MIARNTQGALWKWEWLVRCQLTAFAVVISWFFAPTRELWDRLDLAIFLGLNETLSAGPVWQTLWALANHRGFDITVAVVYVALFLHFSFSDQQRFVRERLAAGCFIALYTFLVLELSRNFVFTFDRMSPTLVVDGALRLSQLVPWANPKDFSGSSFPGDHAIALAIFTTVIWFYAGRRYGLTSLAIALPCILPRLISGAHWASDVLVGSTFICLLSLSLVLATPAHLVVVRSFLIVINGMSDLAARLGTKFGFNGVRTER